PYCITGTDVLKNKLNIVEEDELAEAELALTEVAAADIEFAEPPYDFDYLKKLHKALFEDIYDWAGKRRSVDISKGKTRFCVTDRIEPEIKKLFKSLAEANYFCGLSRNELIPKLAEFYIELNMIHPFREGNGRVQRILFEHIVINCGLQFSLEPINEQVWIEANIA